MYTRTWLSSRFMHNDEVCNVVGFAGPHQCRNLMVSSVHALSSREHQLHLLNHIMCVKLNRPMHLTHCYWPTLPFYASKSETDLTLANILSLELGSLDVVTMSLGSSTPAHLYSSSI